VYVCLLLRKIEIARERSLGPAILLGVGFDRRDQLGDVGRIDGLIGDELGEIVLLRIDVDVEVEVRRIHAANAQIGDIAHDADRHRHIEGGEVVFVLTRKLLDASGPARTVVVLGVQALRAGGSKGLDKGCRLGGGLAIARPRDLVVAVVVEGEHRGLIVGVVRPAQDGKGLHRNQRLDVVRVVGRVGCGDGLAMAMAAVGQQQCGG
jgi:hypothetical protein